MSGLRNIEACRVDSPLHMTVGLATATFITTVHVTKNHWNSETFYRNIPLP